MSQKQSNRAVIVETDYAMKSGRGVAVFSRPGISTIWKHKEFRQDRLDNPDPVEPAKRSINQFNADRLSAGISREEYKRFVANRGGAQGDEVAHLDPAEHEMKMQIEEIIEDARAKAQAAIEKARLEAEGEMGPIEKVKPISKEQALHILIAR